MDTESIVKKIISLFALADPSRNSSEGERENALRKAHELMESYEISMSRIDALRSGVERGWISEPAAGRYLSRVEKSDQVLAVAVSKLLGLKPVFTTSRHRGQAMLFCGDRASVSIGQELFAVLKRSMYRTATQSVRTARQRRKFRYGFALGILVQVNKIADTPAMQEKAQWAEEQTAERMQIARRRISRTPMRSLASRAGFMQGTITDIGYEQNLGSTEQPRLA